MKTLLSSLLTVLLALPAIATTVPFTYEKHIIFVQVQSPTNPSMRFILDTGASPTAVESITAERSHVGHYKGSEPVNGFENISTVGIGNSPGSFIRGFHATCGGMPLRRTAVSTDLISVSLSAGHYIDGLLGTDFLRNKILTIDFKSKTLDVMAAPGTDNGFTKMIDDIPFSDRHDMVYAIVQTPQKSLVFLVDTGSTRSVIDAKTASRFNLLAGKETKVNVVGGKATGSNVRGFVGSFEGSALPSDLIALDLSRVSFSLNHHVDGILGMDFLESHAVQLDFHKSKMHFLDSPAQRSIAAR